MQSPQRCPERVLRADFEPKMMLMTNGEIEQGIIEVHFRAMRDPRGAFSGLWQLFATQLPQ